MRRLKSGLAKNCHPWLAQLPRPAADGPDLSLIIPCPNICMGQI